MSHVDYTVSVHSPNFITYMTGSSPAGSQSGERGARSPPHIPGPLPSPPPLREVGRNGVTWISWQPGNPIADWVSNPEGIRTISECKVEKGGLNRQTKQENSSTAEMEGWKWVSIGNL